MPWKIDVCAKVTQVFYQATSVVRNKLPQTMEIVQVNKKMLKTL